MVKLFQRKTAKTYRPVVGPLGHVRRIEDKILYLWECGYSTLEIKEMLGLKNRKLPGRALHRYGITTSEIRSRAFLRSKEKGVNILQYDLDGNFMKEWSSQAAAEREYGMAQGTIHKVLIGEQKTAFGYQWVEKTSDDFPKQIAARPRKTVILQCDKEGNVIKEWPSANAAEKELGIYPNSISKVLRGQRETTGGFYWKKVEVEDGKEN